MHDDVPNIVSIAPRFDLTSGVTERFGLDIHEILARDKEIRLEQRRDDGKVISWNLTKWVSFVSLGEKKIDL